MTVRSPVFLQSGSYAAEDVRRALQTHLSAGGVITATDLVVTAVSGLTVAVAPGQIWIPGTESGATSGMGAGFYTQGSYYCYLDASMNLTCAAANPTNPRIDLVVAVVNDSGYTSPGYGSSNTWTPAIVTGTPASSPVAPSAPGSSIALATILVPAGSSSISTITNEQPYARLGLGLLPPFVNGVGSGFTVNNSANASESLGSIVVPKACTLALSINASVILNGSFQGFTLSSYIDGTLTTVGGYNSLQIHATTNDFFPISTKGTTHVAAGTHTLSAYGQCGGGGSSVTLQDIYWEAAVVGP